MPVVLPTPLPTRLHHCETIAADADVHPVPATGDLATVTGLEPATSALTRRRSALLSYTASGAGPCTRLVPPRWVSNPLPGPSGGQGTPAPTGRYRQVSRHLLCSPYGTRTRSLHREKVARSPLLQRTINLTETVGPRSRTVPGSRTPDQTCVPSALSRPYGQRPEESNLRTVHLGMPTSPCPPVFRRPDGSNPTRNRR